MAYHTVRMIRELNLDHNKVCGLCGHRFQVISRIYGEGIAGYGSSLIIDKSARAQRRVEVSSVEDLKRQTRNVKDYHRCPKCGRYDQQDIQKFSAFYSTYTKKIKIRKLMKLIVGIFMALFLPIAISLILIFPSEEKATPDSSFWEGLLGLIIIILWYVLALRIIWRGIKTRPMEESEYIQHINSPEICVRWLKRWEKKSNQNNLNKIINDRDSTVEIRQMYWGSIYNAQHYLDPL